MTISLSLFYYIYLVFVLIFLVFTFFNIYHLVRFGYLTLANIILVGFYLIVSILILSISWRYITTVDWSQTINLIPTLDLGHFNIWFVFISLTV